jgi:hypothetical protein
MLRTRIIRRFFTPALASAATFWNPISECWIARLDQVRISSDGFGYGLGDSMDSMLAKYATDRA